MSRQSDDHLQHGELLEEHSLLSIADLCRICAVEERQIEALIEEGVITTIVVESERRVAGAALRRTRIAVRLQRDLGINLPGVALALDLLEELEQLRRVCEADRP